MRKAKSKTMNLRFASNTADSPNQLIEALKKIQVSTADPSIISIVRKALDHAGFENHLVRISLSDHAILTKRAEDACLTISEFVRRKALGKNTRVNVPVLAFDRLRSAILAVRQRYPLDKDLQEDLMSTLMELGFYET